MSISLYSGTPGSGKSFYATKIAVRLLQQGTNVICNYGLNTNKINHLKGKFKYVDNSLLTVSFLIDWFKRNHVYGKEGQTVVIIDEAGIFFNPRDYNNIYRMDWIKLFATHRHLGFSFILIAQFDKMIDKQIRAMIETEYKFRAVKHYKTFGRLLSFLTGGLFVKVEFWYGTRLRCGSEWFTFSKKIAGIYDSYQMFEKSV